LRIEGEVTKVSESDELYTEDDCQENNEYSMNEAISDCNNFYTDGEYIWGVNSEHKVYFRYPLALLESVCLKYSEEDEDNDYWYDLIFHTKTGQVLNSLKCLWEQACEVQDWAIALIAEYNADEETV
jgi:hypothetical protein